MIAFVSPASGAPLQRRGDRWVSAEGEDFPVVAGVPRFVGSEHYAGHFGLQWRRHPRTQLDSHTGQPISRRRLEGALGAPAASLRGLEVLEAGCGAGRFTEVLADAGAQVHAVDLSSAVEANRANLGERPDYVVAQADLRRLPFPPGSFDVVICLGVIQHTPSPEETIARLYAMVKPGGRLVIDHYERRRWWTRPLLPVYRQLLKRLPTESAHRVTDLAARAWFPLHWGLRKSAVAQGLLNRVSPCCFYYRYFPELTREQHREWSILDTHDVLTDHFKHYRSPQEIRRALESLGAEEVEAWPGGNGVEARCRKPASVPASTLAATPLRARARA
jgi:2-polyprenyl-3-methyl-5-hydroxy-6-metoxy-1,4-benzoquinol methylase